MGWQDTSAIDTLMAPHNDPVSRELATRIAARKATWNDYPCRCPRCGRFQPGERSRVALAWVFAVVVLAGPIILACLVSPVFLFLYVYILLILRPWRSIVSYEERNALHQRSLGREDALALVQATLTKSQWATLYGDSDAADMLGVLSVADSKGITQPKE
jgi:hypothetical protein